TTSRAFLVQRWSAAWRPSKGRAHLTLWHSLSAQSSSRHSFFPLRTSGRSHSPVWSAIIGSLGGNASCRTQHRSSYSSLPFWQRPEHGARGDVRSRNESSKLSSWPFASQAWAPLSFSRRRHPAVGAR